MRTVFDKTELLVLLQDFYELTKLRAVVFDAWGTDILSFPGEHPLFCQLIRQSNEGKNNCLLCDQRACDMAQKSTKAIIYPCHAGLLEMIMPICVEEATVGYLLLSHIVQEDQEKTEWKRVLSECKNYHIPQNKLKYAFDCLPRISQKVLKASGDLLALAAKALYQERLAGFAPDSLQTRLSSFLSSHLSEDLSCERLCKELTIGRTSLYRLSYEVYGCGISEQVSRMRVQLAKKLLCDTNLSIVEICQKTGFNDYNYFYRVFRKHTGTTPKTYRRRSELEAQ